MTAALVVVPPLKRTLIVCQTMAFGTKRNEVEIGIVSAAAAEMLMVHLQVMPPAAPLAFPSISAENLKS